MNCNDCRVAKARCNLYLRSCAVRRGAETSI